MDRIKVLLVDDHTLFRDGMKALLSRQESVEIIGEAGSGAEGIEKALELSPDVVLMDLNMPDMTGIEAIRKILEVKPETKILMLTVSEDDEDLFNAVRAGAMGYLLKNVESERLVSSVQQVARGEATVSAALTDRIFAEFRAMSARAQKSENETQKDLLSNREKEILVHISRGESNKEIANVLCIAESTVKIHVQNILKKLNLSSRVQAAVYAVEQSLVPPKKN
ncbi:MAG: response regulator transcription factor [Deltaproteobacteria bacterium]|nr:response regulator transcription factor [Deltaproteobacteria bacterium]